MKGERKKIMYVNYIRATISRIVRENTRDIDNERLFREALVVTKYEK